MSLESDNNEEDQEVLDDLEHKEEEVVLQVEVKYEDDSVELGEAVDVPVPVPVPVPVAAQEDVVAFCFPYKGNICYCEDERQAIFINSEADLKEEEEVLQVEYEDDEIYWSAEEDNEDETADSAEAPDD